MTDRDRIIEAVEAYAVAGELACADAHTIAEQIRVTPIEIGRVVNKATELRFFRCQLGVFGYGDKAAGKSKIVLAAANVPDDLREVIESRVANERISCAAVWEIAKAFKYPRLGVANVVEALGYRITPCQLGCF